MTWDKNHLSICILFGCLSTISYGCGDLDKLKKSSQEMYNTITKGSNSQTASNGNTGSEKPQTPPDPAFTALAQGPFGGITVIKFTDQSFHPGKFLIIFVSPKGTYAQGGFAEQPGGPATPCIAWVTDKHSDPSELTFGLLNSEIFGYIPEFRNIPKSGQKVCSQFTVRHESENTIRITSGIYNRKGKILARIPLDRADWTNDALGKHTIKSIRLGPVSSGVKKAVPFNPAGLQHGVFLQYAASAPGSSSSTHPSHQINGFAAASEITGWPFDMLVAAWSGESLEHTGKGSDFNQAVLAKYGQPTKIVGEKAYWIYDLQGKLLREQDTSAKNCLGTWQEEWNRTITRGAVAGGMPGIGPWGCSLIFTHTYAKENSLIRDYGMSLVSGSVWGLADFTARLEEVDKTAKWAHGLRSTKPKL